MRISSPKKSQKRQNPLQTRSCQSQWQWPQFAQKEAELFKKQGVNDG
jgi:hypothetical protein